MSRKITALVIVSSILVPTSLMLPINAQAEPQTNEICNDNTIWATSYTDVMQISPEGKILKQEKIEGMDDKSTNKQIYDTAISKNGEKLYIVTSSSIQIYDIEGKKVTKVINLTNTPSGNANSLSLYGDSGVLLGFSKSKNIYAIEDIEKVGDNIDLKEKILVEGKNSDFTGYSGDFITYADGSILAFADDVTNQTKVILFEKTDEGKYNDAKVIGTTVHNGDPIEAYGGTFSNGEVYIASKTGLYKMKKAPSSNDKPDTKHELELVMKTPEGSSILTGATSVQEGNAVCSAPNMNVTKTAGSVKDNGDGTATASYKVTVTNEGSKKASFSSLFDNPGFNENYELVGASWKESTDPAPAKESSDTNTNEEKEDSQDTNKDNTKEDPKNTEKPTDTADYKENKNIEAEGQSLNDQTVDAFAAEENNADQASSNEENKDQKDDPKDSNSTAINADDVEKVNSENKDNPQGDKMELPEGQELTIKTDLMWKAGQEKGSTEEGGFYITETGTSLEAGKSITYDVDVVFKPKDYNAEPSKCATTSEKGQGLHNYAGLANEEKTDDNTACIDAITVTPYNDDKYNTEITTSVDNNSNNNSGNESNNAESTDNNANFPEGDTNRESQDDENSSDDDTNDNSNDGSETLKTDRGSSPKNDSATSDSVTPQYPLASPISSNTSGVQGATVDTGGNVENIWVKIKNIFL